MAHKIIVHSILFCLSVLELNGQDAANLVREAADLYRNFSVDDGKLVLTEKMPDVPIFAGHLFSKYNLADRPEITVPKSFELFLINSLPDKEVKSTFFLVGKYNYSNEFDSYLVIRKVLHAKTDSFQDEKILLVNMTKDRVLSFCQVACQFRKIDLAAIDSYTVNLGSQGFTQIFESTDTHIEHSDKSISPVIRSEFEINKTTGVIKMKN